MKDLDDETIEQPKIDIENLIIHLMKAYPTARYVALNAAITIHNQDVWKDHWYFVGFSDEPVYQEMDGYPYWVANEDIHISDDEWGLFFMHVTSKDLVYRDVKIQESPYDFASPRYFCWKLNEDGETLTQIISEELPVLDEKKSNEEFGSTFKDMMDTTLLKPVMNALDPKNGGKH